MRQRHLRRIAIALGLSAVLAGLALGPVSASYPGQHNGRIAIGVRANGAANIFTLRPDGSGMRQLTSGPGFKLCPSYSPDGQTIAYCATAGRCLRDLDDEAEREEAAPADAPRRLRDLPGLLARRIEDRLRRDRGDGPERRDLHRRRADRRRPPRPDQLRVVRRRAASTTSRCGRRTGRRSSSSTPTTSTPTVTRSTSRSGSWTRTGSTRTRSRPARRPRTRSPTGARTARRSSSTPATSAAAGSG